MKLMPQEIEVWYLIPAIRKELTLVLIKDFHCSQKDVADILGVTESAVSQYIKAKRANELQFSKQELDEIKRTADIIIKNKKNAYDALYKLTIKLRGTENLCKFHKKRDKSLPINCKICCESL